MKPIMQKKALENAELCKELVQHMVVVVVQKRTCGGGVVLVGEEVAVGSLGLRSTITTVW